ncbi:hypothetical protein YC2023_030552 [Brassica napus]
MSGSNRGSSRFINKKLLIFISLIERIIVKASAFFVSLSCMVLDCLIVAEKLKVCLVRKSCDSLLIDPAMGYLISTSTYIKLLFCATSHSLSL